MSISNLGQVQNLLKQGSMEQWTSKVGNVDMESGSVDISKLNGAFGTEFEKTQGKSFGEFLQDSLVKVNDIQQEANKAIEKLATGESTNIHETMLMVEQAEIAFKTMNQIRSKVLEAYKEVMRMQI